MTLLVAACYRPVNKLSAPTISSCRGGIVRGNDRFLAVGASGTVIWSSDSLKWYAAAPVPFTASLEDVAFGECRFVAISTGSIYVSTNGNDWAYAYSGNSLSFYDIGYGNGRFIVGGYNSYPFPYGCLLSSSNGVTWEWRADHGQWIRRHVLPPGSKFATRSSGGMGNRGASDPQ